EADVAAGARLVLDHDRPLRVGADRLRHAARQHVGAACRRERNDEAGGLRGVGIRGEGGEGPPPPQDGECKGYERAPVHVKRTNMDRKRDQESTRERPMKTAIRFFFAMAFAAGLAGCVVYDYPPPGYTTTAPGPSAYERAWNNAMGALV